MTEATTTAKAKWKWRWPWREPTKFERSALRLAQAFSVFIGFACMADALVRVFASRPQVPPMTFIGALFFAYGISGLARWRVSIPLGAAVALLSAMSVVAFIALLVREGPGEGLVPVFVAGALTIIALIGMREPLESRPAAGSTKGSYGEYMRDERSFTAKSDAPVFRD